MTKPCTFCKYAMLGNNFTLVCLKAEQPKGIVSPNFTCLHYKKSK